MDVSGLVYLCVCVCVCVCERPHLHVCGYPSKRILLKTFTQTIYTKTPKTYSECGYFVNGYSRSFSCKQVVNALKSIRL